ncbi:MAG TPA: efflux RND transporter periplasmic adaptor subunit [Thermoanaerobaculia bacterium]|nr:efflux RND transporter periplasmic adaptor subunit [Thermoanaerobaculia bacterium]HUM28960.1 efflux RND transporter periplasmic adaptor subunit [Thermoanaerobaculia bacterium]HXK67108.1 efflux RND transporter periplasmic adaptor subunit [Thermoanaerobaculia bacterium]
MNFSRQVRLQFTQIITLCGLMFLSACAGDSGASSPGPGGVVPAVEAVQARFGNLPLKQRVSGVVEAKNQINVYPELSAVIVEVFVKNGDVVKEGDPLIRLRDREFLERLKQAEAGYQIAVAQLKQAEARLKEARSELKRRDSLAREGLASSTDLETAQLDAISAEADVALAQARVEQAKATAEERDEALSQALIRSPIRGVVGNRNAEVGMLVTGSTRLFTLGQMDKVRVNVILTDRMLQSIHVGQRVEIASDHTPDQVIEAKLSRISPFLNPVTHTTEAEIDLGNPGGTLRSGMFVTVDIYYGESEQATLVPLSALYENPEDGLLGVYVADSVPDGVQKTDTSELMSRDLSEPVNFKFQTVNVVAKGRLEAGIRGVESGQWVITLGQNLLGGKEGMARVRKVTWNWVESLQKVQREDLMEPLVARQSPTGISQ